MCFEQADVAESMRHGSKNSRTEPAWMADKFQGTRRFWKTLQAREFSAVSQETRVDDRGMPQYVTDSVLSGSILQTP